MRRSQEKNIICKGRQTNNGITLIALVITIIVLLILVGVSIATLTGENGILNQADKAGKETKVKGEEEQIGLAYNAVITANKGTRVTEEQLEDELQKYDSGATVTPKGENFEVELSSENVYTVKKDGTIEKVTNAEVTVNGEKITLTERNVKDYLGKVVTNFKEDYEGTEEINGITVSKKYRLYYVDFDGKYEEDGIGRGTIYLKADCTSNKNALTLDSTDADATGIRIKQLNPGLYKDEEGNKKNPPTANYQNMKAVTWLLNENNWSGLKSSNLKTGGITQNDINYIVGAPSLKIMMDSYNTKYSDKFKKTDKPDFSDIQMGGEDRRKLFYQYTEGDTGYKVGPCAEKDAEYGNNTSHFSIWSDSEIDTMYNPGDNHYWLASPSSVNVLNVSCVNWNYSGYISAFETYVSLAFCPLVSLRTGVNIELEG